MKKTLLLLLISKCILAQNLDFTPEILNLNTWNNNASFKNVEKVDFNGKVSGNGSIIFSNKPGELINNVTVNAFRFKAKLMITANGFAEINFDDFNIKFSKNKPGILTTKDTELLPLQKVLKPEGFWQDIEVLLIPKNELWVIDYILLNGIAIHKNIFVSEKKRQLSFKNLNGITAFKDVSLQNLSTERLLNLEDLSYNIAQTTDWNSLKLSQTPKINGKLNEFTIDFPENTYRNYLLTYTGGLNVKEGGEYIFDIIPGGRVSLKINDRDIFSQEEFIREKVLSYKVKLEAGKQRFELTYQKPSWWTAGLGWTVRKANMVTYDLHSKGMLQELTLPGDIDQAIGSQNENIRSFQMFRGKKHTQVISSGSPEGYHFSYDLDLGSVLYFWKGDYADLTDLWHDRGEPQVLEPAGFKFENHGLNPLLNKEVTYKGYTLNNKNTPTFTYVFDNNALSNTLTASEEGFINNYTLEIPGNSELLIWEGNSIEKINDFTYKTDHCLLVFKKGTKLFLKEENDKKRLTTTLKDSISYEIQL